MTLREELVGKAAELVPVLRERAAKTEQFRRTPLETVGDFHASGLMRIAQPKRFGGLGLDFDHVLDVAAELARGCGSAGWCYAIWASHNWLMGMFSEQA